LHPGEERLKLALAAARMVSWDWDLRTGKVVCFGDLRLLTGSAAAPAVNEITFDAWTAGIHPDDRESFRRTLRAACTRDGSCVAEYRIPAAEGEQSMWVMAHGRCLVDAMGDPLRVLGVAHDVTAIKRREQARLKELREREFRFRRLVDGNIVGVVIADEDRILEANDVFLDMVGYARADLEAGVLRWREMTPPEYLPSDRTAIEGLLTQGAVTPVEKEYYRKDRSRVPVLVAGSLLTHTPFCVICFVLDLSEQRRAQDELRRANAELARSNSELEEFAFLVAHDLQSPLVSLDGCVQLLAEACGDQLNEEARELIGHVRRSAKHMSRLVRSLLQYARVGRKGPKRIACRVEVLLARVLELLEAKLEAAGARVTHDPLPEVSGDETLLVQLLQNLIENAVKYRGPAPPQVHVSARLDGGDWIFSVKDNGLGIEPRHTGKIFQLFSRLHADDSQYPGVGLGLATCRKIAERHGGRIWVESQPGAGSTFYFSLPSD
jgi:PAS domain S-box-containing protein